jgi:hypothetical protein
LSAKGEKMPKFNQVCPGCGKSFQADTDWIGATVQCPGCERNVVIAIGNTAPTQQVNATNGHVTVEKTKKWIKLLSLINSIVMIVALVKYFSGQQTPGVIVTIVFNILIVVFLRIAKWWNHD